MLRMALIDIYTCAIGSHERGVHALQVAQTVQLVVCGEEICILNAWHDFCVGGEVVEARVGDLDKAFVRCEGWRRC